MDVNVYIRDKDDEVGYPPYIYEDVTGFGTRSDGILIIHKDDDPVAMFREWVCVEQDQSSIGSVQAESGG